MKMDIIFFPVPRLLSVVASFTRTAERTDARLLTTPPVPDAVMKRVCVFRCGGWQKGHSSFGVVLAAHNVCLVFLLLLYMLQTRNVVVACLFCCWGSILKAISLRLQTTHVLGWWLVTLIDAHTHAYGYFWVQAVSVWS